MAFFARELMWDSTVSYWSQSVAIFFYVSVGLHVLPHCHSLSFFLVAKMVLGVV